MNRRIQKSRQAIIDAFMRLMSEKEFERITINQIAEEANVNRGTVYLHFADKYDLRDQCMEAQIKELLRNCMSEDNFFHLPSKTALLRTFEYLEQHASFYSIMLTNKGSTVFSKPNRDNVPAKSVRASGFDQPRSGYEQGHYGAIFNFSGSGGIGMVDYPFDAVSGIGHG